MTSDIWYYCWRQAAAHVPAHLVLLWPVTSPLQPSFVLSLCFDPAGRPETELLGTDGGERWRWGCGGGWGGSLKGIITVSPEYVHNHSVKQTGVGREESTFSSVLLPPGVPGSLAVPHGLQVGRIGQQTIDIMELKEGSFKKNKNKKYSAVFALRWPLISLSPSPQWLGGPGANLSVLSEPLGAVWAGWLPDSMIV